MNGIILVNKPKDLTSRDVVNKVSKILKTKKIGHNGTLDPLATGVLVLCVGKATKLNQELTSKYKEYIAEVTLGIETDTLDITGKILQEDQSKVSQLQLEKTLAKFKTTYMQEVPAYSAVKVNGKKLYEYARNGEQVTLPKKEVTIKEIELLSFEEKKFTFKCLVSKGTYIRSLIRDILKELKVIGCMSNLIRTKQGKFNIEDAYSIDEIENNRYSIISIKDALSAEAEVVDDEMKFKIINGQKLDLVRTKDILFLDKEGNALALYTPSQSVMKVKVMLYENK